MIHISESVQATLAENLNKISYSQLVVLVDSHTKKHCYPLIKPYLPPHRLVEMKVGETYKTLETCQLVWEKFTQIPLERDALLLNLGGGVVGDLGGFCAAVYKRGIRFVQIPTTLLAQVDASVGAKTGIDFMGLKNQLGAFAPPEAVWIYPEFLQTLPPRELLSGFAEVVKHCLIADAAQWNKIRRRDLHEQPLLELIRHSVAIKENIVIQDPTEKGLRKILNFGHSIGHAVESHFLATKPAKQQLLHGEAVAVGMLCESYISHQRGLLDKKQFTEIEEFVFSYFGCVPLTEADQKAILPLLAHDKKNIQNQLMFTLLDGVGKAIYNQAVSKAEVKKALSFYTS